MIDFQRQTINFPNNKRLQTEPLTFTFPTRVIRAEAAISGFNMGFRQSDGRIDDHHFGQATVDAVAEQPINNVVKVNVHFLLQDKDFDDLVSGHVDVLVIVDREPN